MCAFGRVSYTCNGDGKKRRADRLNMLDVRSLYVTYLSEEERVEAVRGIDFSADGNRRRIRFRQEYGNAGCDGTFGS